VPDPRVARQRRPGRPRRGGRRRAARTRFVVLQTGGRRCSRRGGQGPRSWSRPGTPGEAGRRGDRAACCSRGTRPGKIPAPPPRGRGPSVTFPQREADLPNGRRRRRVPRRRERRPQPNKEGVLVGYRWYRRAGPDRPAYPSAPACRTRKLRRARPAPRARGLRGADGRDREPSTCQHGHAAGRRRAAALPRAARSRRPGVTQPPRQLRGYDKLTLDPAESARALRARRAGGCRTGNADQRRTGGPRPWVATGVMAGPPRRGRSTQTRDARGRGASCPRAPCAVPLARSAAGVAASPRARSSSTLRACAHRGCARHRRGQRRGARRVLGGRRTACASALGRPLRGLSGIRPRIPHDQAGAPSVDGRTYRTCYAARRLARALASPADDFSVAGSATDPAPHHRRQQRAASA